MVTITAHRGASGIAPENTMAAFHRAVAQKADFIELDVQLSKDDQVVVFHNPTLKRTTNGRGRVANKTLDELKALDAGLWFSEAFEGERIPTLDQVLAFARGKVGLNIEIKKQEKKDRVVDKVVTLIKTFGMENNCCITSFDPMILDLVKSCDASLRTGLIVGKRHNKRLMRERWDILSVHHHAVSQNIVDACRQSGCQLHAWTVNEIADMERMIALGIDGIITNYPGRLRRLLAK
jgi:glycerophosphoryl diester phosphodiesterase